jgi:hypothetical protein
MPDRTPSYQTISWLVDLHRNGQLDLSPPYQRNSVWNQEYRDYFIDTILNSLPFPPVFLHREIDANGHTTYHVVDGKQRLEAIIGYVGGEFPTPATYRGANGYFSDLTPPERRAFYEYLVYVEFLSDTRETTLNDVFNRFNRNVAQLKPQELRHARFSGAFIQLSERLAELLPEGFPNISKQDRRRMRDVEYASTLLLYLERGAKSTSQNDIDEAYAAWDQELPDIGLEGRFVRTIDHISSLIALEPDLQKSRFHNLADYYSLFGAISSLDRPGWTPTAEAGRALVAFAARVEEARLETTNGLADEDAKSYYEAVRSASNDAGPRQTRVDILRRILPEPR